MKAYFNVGKDQDAYTKAIDAAFACGFKWQGDRHGYCLENFINYAHGANGFCVMFHHHFKYIQTASLRYVLNNPKTYFEIKNIKNLACWLKTGKTKMRIG